MHPLCFNAAIHGSLQIKMVIVPLRRMRLMTFNKLGRRKNPHPNPPPYTGEGTIARRGNPYLIVKKHKPSCYPPDKSTKGTSKAQKRAIGITTLFSK